jgi:ABC-type sugar transport system ATPase subunit
VFPQIVPRGEEILRVEDLNRAGVLSDIHFTTYAGEVLGIAGLVGAGRTELARAVFGADLIDSGKFFVKGQPVTREVYPHQIAFNVLPHVDSFLPSRLHQGRDEDGQ